MSARLTNLAYLAYFINEIASSKSEANNCQLRPGCRVKIPSCVILYPRFPNRWRISRRTSLVVGSLNTTTLNRSVPNVRRQFCIKPFDIRCFRIPPKKAAISAVFSNTPIQASFSFKLYNPYHFPHAMPSTPLVLVIHYSLKPGTEASIKSWMGFLFLYTLK